MGNTRWNGPYALLNGTVGDVRSRKNQLVHPKLLRALQLSLDMNLHLTVRLKLRLYRQLVATDPITEYARCFGVTSVVLVAEKLYILRRQLVKMINVDIEGLLDPVKVVQFGFLKGKIDHFTLAIQRHKQGLLSAQIDFPGLKARTQAAATSATQLTLHIE